MSVPVPSAEPRSSAVVYPESDGKPLADNTVQYRWMTLIKENLDRAHADSFVAANLIWYPLMGRNDIWRAPDVMVAMGRPKGDRGSYQQWNEGGVAPHVVFEIWSPSNTLADAVDKHTFYQTHGVQEYYLYNPQDGYLAGWLRTEDRLVEQPTMAGYRSPRLGFRFEFTADGLRIEHADGSPFLSFEQIFTMLDQERTRADSERQRADSERQRADSERQRADSAESRAAALAEQLRRLGVNPDLP